MCKIINYLGNVDKEMVNVTQERCNGLEIPQWTREYGLQVLASEFHGHEKDVVNMLRHLLSKRFEYSAAHHKGDDTKAIDRIGTEEPRRRCVAYKQGPGPQGTVRPWASAVACTRGQDMRAMRVRPALSCNYELLMHNTDMQKFVLALFQVRAMLGPLECTSRIQLSCWIDVPV